MQSTVSPLNHVLLIVCTGTIVLADSDWSYNNPEDWPGMCKAGEHQSPINLVQRQAIKQFAEPLVFLQYEAIVKGNLTNDGHTVIVDVDQPCSLAVTGGGLRELYQFYHLHFHWPSEHTLNNERMPLEMHFVHFNKKKGNIETAISHGKGLAVIAVLFHESPESNSHLDPILAAMEEAAGTVGHTVELKEAFSPGDLLPEGTEYFYRYQGSLTTPPCTESVQWTVLQALLPISQKQLAAFQSVNSSVGRPLDHTYRPVQPINDRTLWLVSDREKYDNNDLDNDLHSLRASMAHLATSHLLWAVLVTYIVQLLN